MYDPTFLMSHATLLRNEYKRLEDGREEYRLMDAWRTNDYDDQYTKTVTVIDGLLTRVRWQLAHVEDLLNITIDLTTP